MTWHVVGPTGDWMIVLTVYGSDQPAPVYTHIMDLGNRSITSIHSQYHHLIILYIVSCIATLYGNYITPALW